MLDSSEVGSKCLTKGSNNFLGCKIDQNLTVTQGIMGFLNTVDTVDDPILEKQVDKAKWFAGVGTSGPAIVAGTMLIMFRIAMALFIGFGPIFILCLMFKKTAPLFQKWLYYGLATIFSGVMLAVMADIAMDLVSNIGSALFISKEAVYFFTGENVTGIMDAATQQLGLGLILSTLLVVVPPMAGMFFNGVMASFSPYSAIDRWNNPQGGGVPPHLDGGRSMTEQRANQVVQNIAQQHQTNQSAPSSPAGWRVGTSGSYSSSSTEAVKSLTQAERAALNTTTQIAQPKDNTDKEKGEKA